MITLTTDEKPFRAFRLKYCTISYFEHFVWTAFPDGAGFGGTVPTDPIEADRYLARAQRLGYADSISYCREHDFLHSYLAQEVPVLSPDVPAGRSAIMWSMAYEWGYAPPITTYEEAQVILFQSFLRAGEDMDAVSPDVDWLAIRQKAWKLLGD